MKYTDEKPTVPGWYWYRIPVVSRGKSIMHIRERTGVLVYEMDERIYAVDSLPSMTQFAGPIPEPDED